MKICVVTMRATSYYGVSGSSAFGGAEVQSAFVADALRAAGHEVVLVVADLPAGVTLPHAAENAYHTGDGIPGLRFFHPRWSGTMAALERADADVYFQHCAGMITGQVALFCRRRKRVFVYGAGSDMEFHPDEASVPIARDRLLFRYGLRRCTGLVVQNERQRAAARSLNKPTRLIPTGIRMAEGGDDGAREAVVWIGGLRTLKRPDRLLDLACRMPERKFVVVGGDYPGEPAYSERVRAEAGTIANVTMLGRRPHGEVAGILSRAAVLVNTSEVEGFPNAYLEAWSSGVPVVTFNDVDGIIRGSGAGVVVNTIDEMAETIRALDRDARRAMGEAARRLVKERFSPEHLGAEYVSFFSSLRP